ncbi:potassium/proton antiporter [Alkalihalophilus lindianensis]|uniref:Potassium/proton antiporter n=1 Tax=Alkalihalophilus lindianensis TaxID=1630542 RepID=A0ABU3X631_9BACI|nr:potassium/proton antiporter [Alkalihalophilus lindianensis]MDV2683363.1 potassium/proton antiporter [Alkalihalophilus lindianensis]
MFETISSNDYFILLAALLLITGVLAAKFSSRFGVPALVLFILLGMAVGSDGIGFIHFENTKIAQLLGIFALVIILFEGGLQTKWQTVKPVLLPSISLATLGVCLTSCIIAVFAKFILGVSWLEGMLFGAIVGSTDAAAVFAVLKGHNIRERLGATLEAESGANDPMAVFLTLSFIQLIITESTHVLLMLLSFVWQMGAGLIIGLTLGKLASIAINRINLDSSGLYPVFTVAFALLTYSLTALIGASGLLAVYICALVIGNHDLTYKHSIFRFNEGFAWIMQISMFVILGLLVYPSQLLDGKIIVIGLLISTILIFIARPIAVFLTTWGMKFDWRERVFLSWAGLRGAVPIVLATFPLIAGLENSQLFFNLIFFIVLTSTLIQGSSIHFFAKILSLTGPKKVTPMHTLELISIGKANAEIIEYEVNEETAIVGQQLKDISFPKDVLINVIIRDGELITPTGETKIEIEDTLYILVSRKSEQELKNLLHRTNQLPSAH